MDTARATSWRAVPDSVSVEARRLSEQTRLDSQSTPRERNQVGQFATPPTLARDIVSFAVRQTPGPSISFLEPSCGTGAFYSALLDCADARTIREAVGVEFDPRFAAVAADLWSEFGLSVVNDDFTKWVTTTGLQASLLVANPPYVRHHHIPAGTKRYLAELTAARLGLHPSGLAGLYVYFVLLSHLVLEPGAISAWLIPTEFMDVNYGAVLRRYLLERVSLRRVHRFDPSDVQFEDALVSSAVVVFENRPPTGDEIVAFTYGGSITSPREGRTVRSGSLNPGAKWMDRFRAPTAVEVPRALLGDFFSVRRGIATGSNRHFIIPRGHARELSINPKHYKPIFSSPRSVPELVVDQDELGWPCVAEQFALLDSDLSPTALEREDPALFGYFEQFPDAVKSGYLVTRRTPWYRQEQRPPAPFLCTYMGRGTGEKQPFRFILNKSGAIGTNLFLLMYPTPLLQRYLDSCWDGLERVHEALLSLTPDDLRNGGRVYGGGLHKMEPRELAALCADAILALDPVLLSPAETLMQARLPLAS